MQIGGGLLFEITSALVLHYFPCAFFLSEPDRIWQNSERTFRAKHKVLGGEKPDTWFSILVYIY